MTETTTGLLGWERALMAAEKVKERLRRATHALEEAKVPYAVVGGNAVAEWVARVDEDAVRNTRDVDIMILRESLPAARTALESVGFLYHRLLEIDTFIDGPDGKPSGGIHILYASEKVRREDEHSLPGLDESERGSQFQVAKLEALVLMKLTAYRRKDQVHLLDLIGVGLLDRSWPARFPKELADRLQQLLDDPNG